MTTDLDAVQWAVYLGCGAAHLLSAEWGITRARAATLLVNAELCGRIVRISPGVFATTRPEPGHGLPRIGKRYGRRAIISALELLGEATTTRIQKRLGWSRQRVRQALLRAIASGEVVHKPPMCYALAVENHANASGRMTA